MGLWLITLSMEKRQTTEIKLQRVFDYWESDRITGVNENIICISFVILLSILSGFELDTEELNKYTKQYPLILHVSYCCWGHCVYWATLRGNPEI